MIMCVKLVYFLFYTYAKEKHEIASDLIPDPFTSLTIHYFALTIHYFVYRLSWIELSNTVTIDRVVNITDFSVEVRNSENDPYFSRFLYEVLKFSDFLRLSIFFNIFYP